MGNNDAIPRENKHILRSGWIQPWELWDIWPVLYCLDCVSCFYSHLYCITIAVIQNDTLPKGWGKKWLCTRSGTWWCKALLSKLTKSWLGRSRQQGGPNFDLKKTTQKHDTSKAWQHSRNRCIYNIVWNNTHISANKVHAGGCSKTGSRVNRVKTKSAAGLHPIQWKPGSRVGKSTGWPLSMQFNGKWEGWFPRLTKILIPSQTQYAKNANSSFINRRIYWHSQTATIVYFTFMKIWYRSQSQKIYFVVTKFQLACFERDSVEMR